MSFIYCLWNLFLVIHILKLFMLIIIKGKIIIMGCTPLNFFMLIYLTTQKATQNNNLIQQIITTRKQVTIKSKWSKLKQIFALYYIFWNFENISERSHFHQNEKKFKFLMVALLLSFNSWSFILKSISFEKHIFIGFRSKKIKRNSLLASFLNYETQKSAKFTSP